MRLFSSKAGRIVAPIALTLLLGGSAYAFMATNNVDQSSAGTGAGAITGYTVGDVSYTLSGKAGDPDNITAVSFSLTPDPGGQAATSVAVWFDNNKNNVASTALGTCSMTGSSNNNVTTWKCTIGWDQEAGPNPTSTVLDVAAAH